MNLRCIRVAFAVVAAVTDAESDEIRLLVPDGTQAEIRPLTCFAAFARYGTA
jgi:hypothetical protein